VVSSDLLYCNVSSLLADLAFDCILSKSGQGNHMAFKKRIINIEKLIDFSPRKNINDIKQSGSFNLPNSLTQTYLLQSQ